MNQIYEGDGSNWEKRICSSSCSSWTWFLLHERLNPGRGRYKFESSCFAEIGDYCRYRSRHRPHCGQILNESGGKRSAFAEQCKRAGGYDSVHRVP
jgi:hypothetical protein